jgi:hypothetical protein
MSNNIIYLKYKLYISIILDSGVTYYIRNDKSRFLDFKVATNRSYFYIRDNYVLIKGYRTITVKVKT